jgi:hypothetical protein
MFGGPAFNYCRRTLGQLMPPKEKRGSQSLEI